MKKNLCFLFFIFMILSVTRLQAQIDLGSKLGAVGTQIAGNGNFSDDFRYSYQAGLYLSFDAPILFGVQTEFLYNRTRFENPDHLSGLEPGLKRMGYWSLPVLFQLRPMSFIKIGAGPQWNIHTNAGKYKLANGENAFKNYLSFAVNAQLKVSKSTQFYIRYNKGLRSFENINDGHSGKINRFEFGIQQSITNR